eukprot:c12211_g1_i1 orf=113-274(+)
MFFYEINDILHIEIRFSVQQVSFMIWESYDLRHFNNTWSSTKMIGQLVVKTVL